MTFAGTDSTDHETYTNSRVLDSYCFELLSQGRIPFVYIL